MTSGLDSLDFLRAYEGRDGYLNQHMLDMSDCDEVGAQADKALFYSNIHQWNEASWSQLHVPHNQFSINAERIQLDSQPRQMDLLAVSNQLLCSEVQRALQPRAAGGGVHMGKVGNDLAGGRMLGHQGCAASWTNARTTQARLYLQWLIQAARTQTEWHQESNLGRIDEHWQ